MPTKQNFKVPEYPLIFAKFPNSIAGPHDAIVIPSEDMQVDSEAELAVVIGRRGKAIAADAAYDYVAGYMALNDVSARRWQFADKQWTRGKSCDTFCPTGPRLTTRDEITDPHNLRVIGRLNGEIFQDSNTSKLIFRVPELISFISEAITLEPGDIIATGTPSGVGVFRKPPVFMKAGDVAEVEIEGLGVLRNAAVGRAVGTRRIVRAGAKSREIPACGKQASSARKKRRASVASDPTPLAPQRERDDNVNHGACQDPTMAH